MASNEEGNDETTPFMGNDHQNTSTIPTHHAPNMGLPPELWDAIWDYALYPPEGRTVVVILGWFEVKRNVVEVELEVRQQRCLVPKDLIPNDATILEYSKDVEHIQILRTASSNLSYESIQLVNHTAKNRARARPPTRRFRGGKTISTEKFARVFDRLGRPGIDFDGETDLLFFDSIEAFNLFLSIQGSYEAGGVDMVTDNMFRADSTLSAEHQCPGIQDDIRRAVSDIHQIVIQGPFSQIYFSASILARTVTWFRDLKVVFFQKPEEIQEPDYIWGETWLSKIFNDVYSEVSTNYNLTLTVPNIVLLSANELKAIRAKEDICRASEELQSPRMFPGLGLENRKVYADRLSNFRRRAIFRRDNPLETIVFHGTFIVGPGVQVLDTLNLENEWLYHDYTLSSHESQIQADREELAY